MLIYSRYTVQSLHSQRNTLKAAEAGGRGCSCICRLPWREGSRKDALRIMELDWRSCQDRVWGSTRQNTKASSGNNDLWSSRSVLSLREAEESSRADSHTWKLSHCQGLQAPRSEVRDCSLWGLGNFSASRGADNWDQLGVLYSFHDCFLPENWENVTSQVVWEDHKALIQCQELAVVLLLTHLPQFSVRKQRAREVECLAQPCNVQVNDKLWTMNITFLLLLHCIMPSPQLC